MATYLYSCEKHGEFEETHSMSVKLEECPHCKKEGLDGQPVKRLISSGGSFVLKGGGWAKDNYSG
jgi:putative FmdB family regulatory protein